MKEPIPLESARRAFGLTDADRVEIARTRGHTALRSQILWGEHCSECAAPACYFACDFYAPRADGHCRRFEEGIVALDDARLGPGAAMEIRFRRWGKLEGRGAVGKASPDAARAAEARYAMLGKLSAAGLGGKTLQRPLVSRLIQRRWRKGGDDLSGFDAFVVEGRIASGTARDFTLTLVPEDKSSQGIFQARFQLGAEWRRFAFPLADIARTLDLAAPRLIQIEPVGEAAGAHVILGLCDFVAFTPEGRAGLASAAAPSPNTERKAKLVIWDLDHTVWSGVLAEDGIEGLSLRPGVAEAMRTLDARGVLQSVASKNSHDEAMQALAHFGLDDLMLAPQISWGPKSAAIGAIRDALSLGVDSFVFIDDQPFEREEVRAAHPDIVILDETAIEGLVDLSLFDIPITDESKKRRHLYRIEAERAKAAKGFGEGDIDAFLRSCNLRLAIEPLDAANLERVYELSQRTNQLNVAATRFSREALGELMSDKGREALALRCEDAFGDYGLIGFVAWTPATGEISDYFMSCRVQRKKVENALFGWMTDRAEAAGAAGLAVRWRKAARNALVVELFQELGFTLEKDDEASGRLVRALRPAIAGSDIVRLALRTREAAA